jgi:hypothetical protein
MNVYVFGNEYVAEDKRAIEVARELEGAIVGISFVFVNPNEDVPFVDQRLTVILDTVEEIQDVALVEGDRIDGLVLSPRGSVHDFDLAFQRSPRGASMMPTPLPSFAGTRTSFSSATSKVLRISKASSTHCSISIACARLL